MERTRAAFEFYEWQSVFKRLSPNMQQAFGYFYRAVADVLFRHRGSESAFWRDIDPEMQLRRSSGVWNELWERRGKIAEKRDAQVKKKVSTRRKLAMAKSLRKKPLDDDTDGSSPAAKKVRLSRGTSRRSEARLPPQRPTG